ncbi:lipoyl(octanoyl) transferase LipB [Wohlfahrtiimonas larvae]|uniref:Octanoyltransferase n=1 Tax=Wohlfahrtiimonas larvae TaxID=1157986 RepID=A0ABP9MPQ2_9GAMM|nr:lipoyl(octanoyl) transferase LipB [Wohlfahrtiimonas larvae]
MIIKDLGLTFYGEVYQAMQDFTDQRDSTTEDEFWVTEHYPVFTQGLAGKAEHILQLSDIPIIPTDRGGQVTYHGPKQLVFYPLLNIKKEHISPRPLVSLLEKTTIRVLTDCDIDSYAKPDAPGIYVHHEGEEKKISSLGLRIRKGCCYHGLALNVDMDLQPFSYINPCGYQGLKMINISDLHKNFDINMLKSKFIEYFVASFNELVEQSPRRKHASE